MHLEVDLGKQYSWKWRGRSMTQMCASFENLTKFESACNVQQVMVLRFIADDKLAVALAESALARDVLRR